MIDEEPLCCMCGTTKFIGRINMGEKFYCNACQRKITEEYGPDFWKPCTQVEFFESMLSHMRKKSNRKSTNMLTGLKDQLRQIKDEEVDNDKQ